MSVLLDCFPEPINSINSDPYVCVSTWCAYEQYYHVASDWGHSGNHYVSMYAIQGEPMFRRGFSDTVWQQFGLSAVRRGGNCLVELLSLSVCIFSLIICNWRVTVCMLCWWIDPVLNPVTLCTSMASWAQYMSACILCTIYRHLSKYLTSIANKIRLGCGRV